MLIKGEGVREQRRGEGVRGCRMRIRNVEVRGRMGVGPK